MPIESLDEIEDGETYHYGDPYKAAEEFDKEPEAFVFDVDLTFADSEDPIIGLNYHDGYCADVSAQGFERMIELGAVFEGEP